MLAKAHPAVVTAALEQSQAVQELFTSNLKLGLPSAQQAAKQLLVQLYEQVRNHVAPPSSYPPCPGPLCTFHCGITEPPK